MSLHFKNSEIKQLSFIIVVLLSILFGLGWICTDNPTKPVLFISATIGDPNPATDSTAIRYALPITTHVKIWIENRYGQRVNTLFDAIQNSGYRSVVWYLVDSNSIRVSSGIYVAYIEARELNVYGYLEVK